MQQSPDGGETTLSASQAARPSVARGGKTLLLVFVVVSLNMRVAFTGIGPLIPAMGIGEVTATALTTIPPLCMGLFAPLGALARDRIGEERGLFLAMIALTVGIVVRSLGMAGLFAGTVASSAAIAVMNVLTPVLVRKRFAPTRVGVMMGVYAMLMGASAALTAAVTVPLYEGTGSWQIALGIAVVPAILGLALLPTQLRVPHARNSLSANASWSELIRNSNAWAVTGFFSIQTLLFYTLVAWLPAILVDAGTSPASAGTAVALCLIGVAAGGFGGPAWAGRRETQRMPIVVTITLCLAGLGGILFAPVSTADVWAILLGVGLGAGQGIPGVLYVRRAASHHQTAQLSSMAQAIGFLVAATGPVLAAALHGGSGTWDVPLLALVILLLVNLALTPRAGSGTVST